MACNMLPFTCKSYIAGVNVLPLVQIPVVKLEKKVFKARPVADEEEAKSEKLKDKIFRGLI